MTVKSQLVIATQAKSGNRRVSMEILGAGPSKSSGAQKMGCTRHIIGLTIDKVRLAQRVLIHHKIWKKYFHIVLISQSSRMRI
jgi:hypothetical protein